MEPGSNLFARRPNPQVRRLEQRPKRPRYRVRLPDHLVEHRDAGPHLNLVDKCERRRSLHQLGFRFRPPRFGGKQELCSRLEPLEQPAEPQNGAQRAPALQVSQVRRDLFRKRNLRRRRRPEAEMLDQECRSSNEARLQRQPVFRRRTGGRKQVRNTLA